MASVLKEEIWKLRRQFIVTGIGIAGWITFKYLPYSKLVNKTGFLFCGTEQGPRKEIARLRSLGFKLPQYEDNLRRMTYSISQKIIDQAVADINMNRSTPIDVSKVNFATTLAVHLGSEYHSGSLKNGGFIVLPGPFGITQNEKSIYMASKYFDSSSVLFSVLDSSTWKFMVAKEILHLENERNLMKFGMYMGSFLICVSYVIIYKVNQYLNSKEYVNKLTYSAAKRRGQFSMKHVIQKDVKNFLRTSLIFSIVLMFGVSYVIYKILWYQYLCAKTRKIDATLAGMGEDYVKGGKDYFEKMQDSGYFQHHMLANKVFNRIGNKEMNSFMFLIPKFVPGNERLEYFRKMSAQ